MSKSMREAIKGDGQGLQSISASVAETLSGAYDTRSKQQKGADEASKGLMGMGKSAGPTVESSAVKADQQMVNQSSGSADHLDLGMRKQE